MSPGCILLLISFILTILCIGIYISYRKFKLDWVEKLLKKIESKRETVIEKSDKELKSTITTKNRRKDLNEFETSNEIIDENQLMHKINNRKDHFIYRATYHLENKQMRSHDGDFIKSLEEKARSSQKTTIGRPQLVFIDLSNGFPASFHKQSSPYQQFIQAYSGDLKMVELDSQAKPIEHKNYSMDNLDNNVNVRDLFGSNIDIPSNNEGNRNFKLKLKQSMEY